MGLASTVQNAVYNAINTTVGDLAQTVTFSKLSSPSYNVSTGAATATTTSHSVKVVVQPFTEEELTSTDNISTEDLRVLLPKKELTFTPEIDDVITFNNLTYKIISVRLDPAQALFDIQMRVE
tara:strand:+ start:667 stop:1035 length:369 start_codon:yes stop_codon:yes gene_type:complete